MPIDSTSAVSPASRPAPASASVTEPEGPAQGPGPRGPSQLSTPAADPSSADVDRAERPGKPALFKTLGVGLFGASAADAITTDLALSRPGIYEANPLQRNRAVRLTTHAVMPVAMWAVSNKMYDHGNKKAAWALRIGTVAAFGAIAAHNYELSRRR